MTIKDLTYFYSSDSTICIDGKEYSTPTRSDDGKYLIKNVDDPVALLKIDSLLDQKSVYHLENLMDHIALTTARMAVKSKNDRIAIIIAILHDCGKKYTIKVNKRGDLCFYGHEKISAILAEEFIKSHTISVTNKEMKTIFAVISAHMQLKLQKDIALECFINGFCELYGSKAYEYLCMLDEADNGITEEIMNSYKYINIKEDINTGYDIISSFIMDW